MTTCKDCGAPMIMVYARNGMRLEICTGLMGDRKQNVGGAATRALTIGCGSQSLGPFTAFVRLTKLGLADAEIEYLKLRKALENTADPAEMLAQANKALLVGVPVGRLTGVFADVTAVSRSLGKSPAKGLGDLFYGIANASPRRLDNLEIRGLTATESGDPDKVCDKLHEVAVRVRGS